MINDMIKRFISPVENYSSISFWSWNDKLDSEELTLQIHEMKEKGMGGFFAHSREGLETEYLSDEWMDCIKSSIAAAKSCDMKLWLYDEDKFPSGYAGGKVVEKGGDAFKSKAFTIQIFEELTDAVAAAVNDSELLSVYEVCLNENEIVKAKTISIDDFIRESYAMGSNRLAICCNNKTVWLLSRLEHSQPTEWFGGQAYTDTLSPDAVKCFIDVTYEEYKKHVGCEFGKTIPGIFTDEANIGEMQGRKYVGSSWIPWTYGFKEYFIMKREYDPIPMLPYIFYEGKYSAKIRHDYWRTIAERYRESFTVQLSEWCKKNNLLLTGHSLCEDDLGAMIWYNGDVMPNYVHMDMPGIDMLVEQTNEYLTVKQCTSVANQFDKKLVISEMYGCTGWDFTYQGQKWVGDWQYVMGVNVRTQHLSLYSIRGCRKRDFPASFNYNNLAWKYNKYIEDYFCRIASIMSEGEVVRDILVIHPCSSGWAMFGSEPFRGGHGANKHMEMVTDYGKKFNDFCKYMLQAHLDYDLGSEELLKEYGRIEDNKVFIHLKGYSYVILASIKSLYSSTVEYLNQFSQAGGRIFIVGGIPSMIEGVEQDTVPIFAESQNTIILHDCFDLPEAIEKSGGRRISIVDDLGNECNSILFMQRQTKECDIFFLVNNDKENSINSTIRIHSCAEEIFLLDPARGTCKKTGFKTDEKGRVTFDYSFGAVESCILLVNHAGQKLLAKGEIQGMADYLPIKIGNEKVVASSGPSFRYERTVPNVLVLDNCSYRVVESDYIAPDSKWSSEMEVWRSQKELRERLNMRQVFNNHGYQRYKWAYDSVPGDGTIVENIFHFHVVDIPENDIYLAVEKADIERIVFNDVKIPYKIVGWFIDRSIYRVCLGKPHTGVNSLAIAYKYYNRTEIEDCFIIGDFAVDRNRNIIKEPDKIYLGDWALQGFVHYPGSLIYKFNFSLHADSNANNDFKKISLLFGKLSANIVEARVNGHIAGYIAWKGIRKIDITPYLRDINEVELEVMGTQRNMFGPLHQSYKSGEWTSWASFRPTGTQYTKEYVTEQYGIYEQISVIAE